MRPEPLAESTVLMYHSVCAEAPQAGFAPYVLSPSLLGDHMAALSDIGVAVHSSVSPWPSQQREVVLTFDDGYRDFYDVVLPMLQRYSMRASLFVPTAYLGGTARWLDAEGEGQRPILDAAQLRAIAASGLVDIGAHSHTHPPLDQVDAARRRAEIRMPRMVLEDLLQTPVLTFAYPFGYFNGGTRREVMKAGYEVAYAVGERDVHPRDSRLAIPRRAIGPDCTAAQLLRLIQGRSRQAERSIVAAKRHTWRQMRRFARRHNASPSDFPVLAGWQLRSGQDEQGGGE